jgi:hypothetical protein
MLRERGRELSIVKKGSSSNSCCTIYGSLFLVIRWSYCSQPGHGRGLGKSIKIKSAFWSVATVRPKRLVLRCILDWTLSILRLCLMHELRKMKDFPHWESFVSSNDTKFRNAIIEMLNHQSNNKLLKSLQCIESSEEILEVYYYSGGSARYYFHFNDRIPELCEFLRERISYLPHSAASFQDGKEPHKRPTVWRWITPKFRLIFQHQIHRKQAEGRGRSRLWVT